MYKCTILPLLVMGICIVSLAEANVSGKRRIVVANGGEIDLASPLAAIQSHHWPHNVSSLQQGLERVLVRGSGVSFDAVVEEFCVQRVVSAQTLVNSTRLFRVLVDLVLNEPTWGTFALRCLLQRHSLEREKDRGFAVLLAAAVAKDPDLITLALERGASPFFHGPEEGGGALALAILRDDTWASTVSTLALAPGGPTWIPSTPSPKGAGARRLFAARWMREWSGKSNLSILAEYDETADSLCVRFKQYCEPNGAIHSAPSQGQVLEVVKSRSAMTLAALLGELSRREKQRVLDVQDKYRRTSLHWAAWSGNVEAARAIRKAIPHLVHSCDSLGRRPAHIAHSKGWTHRIFGPPSSDPCRFQTADVQPGSPSLRFAVMRFNISRATTHWWEGVGEEGGLVGMEGESRGEEVEKVGDGGGGIDDDEDEDEDDEDEDEEGDDDGGWGREKDTTGNEWLEKIYNAFTGVDLGKGMVLDGPPKHGVWSGLHGCSIETHKGIPKHFLRDYVVRDKPVLMKQAAKHWKMRKQWKKDRIVESKIRGSVSAFPYSKGQERNPMTVEQYLNTSSSNSNPTSQNQPSLPLYLFDFFLPNTSRTRAFTDISDYHRQDYSSVLSAMTWPLPQLQSSNKDIDVVSPSPIAQFFVGTAATGASLHHHLAAVNAVAYGRKLWAITKPADAVFSAAPAAEYFLHSIPPALKQNITTLCVQEASDLIFVPHGWGHAILNLQETVGLAVEFKTLDM